MPLSSALFLPLVLFVSVVTFDFSLAEIGTSTRGSCPCVTRAQWRARGPQSIRTMRTPVSLVFIHHTGGMACWNLASCSRVMQSLQNDHMDNPWKRYSDIGYNFLVGGDGRIYEGRGWDREGVLTKNYNSRAVSISFMGNFKNQTPTSSALDAAQKLIAWGVRHGKVSRNYKVYGHRQARGAASTTCPGNKLYSAIWRWDRYTAGTAP